MIRLIFGCGYLGHRVAQRWIAAGDVVFAVSRSAQRAGELASAGCTPIVADVLGPDSLSELPTAHTVLFAVARGPNADASLHQLQVDGLTNVLQSLSSATGRVIYVSTTGVYGDSDGGWVDEQSHCEPSREGGRACLAAEHLLAQPSWRGRSTVLRMAGLYGPGRLPLATALRAGSPLVTDPDGRLNLIHVDDAAAAVVAAASAGGDRYCVSDGQPVVRRQFYEHLAHLLQTPPPVFRAVGSEEPRLRRATSKRVSNRRMIEELRIRLMYPSYREGLAAIAAAGGGED